MGGGKRSRGDNTASDNRQIGIDAGASFGGTGHLVTGNDALNNSIIDFAINCPSTVTNNTSTNGFPASYFFGIVDTDCHPVVNNN